MKISRREFIKVSALTSASALLSRYVGMDQVFGKDVERSHPNILVLLVDQQRIPPAYGPDQGETQGLKEILGFQAISPDNPFTKFFPGNLRLRQNAVVMRTHYTASAACVPSRTCIMTGSYSTGVEQTDGGFRSPENTTWLDPDGTPTIGDWFRAAGYSTHYFGKWHVSDPEAPGSLEPWGFSGWESTYPEPHGGGAWNLGVYRDVRFTDVVIDFLAEKGKDSSNTPWLVVGSLVNPHDLYGFPMPWQTPLPSPNNGVVPWTGYPPPPGIPAQGEQSYEKLVPPPPYENGKFVKVDLNPDGFPQDNCSLPPTFEESLDDKPRCQYDCSLKWSLMFKSVQENNMKAAGLPNFHSAYPFQLQGEYATAWSLAYNQFYEYCHYLADLQLRRILQALDDNELTGNTIVVFLSDHGELAGAHGGMIQKWHNAYEESIRVPMVISSPLVNRNKQRMREIFQPTSSIDLAPTLLGLAGFEAKELQPEMEAIHGKSVVSGLVGADLSSYVKGESAGDIRGPDGKPRPGVFFMTNDMITELPTGAEPFEQTNYDAYLYNVEQVRALGYPLESGPVTQPNNVRALCTGDWKIVRYVDPNGIETDEWELYCLRSDPIEETNLVDFRTGEVRDDVSVPGLKKNELRWINKRLKKELAQQEAAALGKSR